MSTTGTNAAAMELSEGALKRRAADAAGFGVKEGQQVRGAFDAASILALEIDDRNKEARLEREKTDDNRFAEISGTRAGHVEVTGAGAKEKARQTAQAKARAADRAKTQALLALQAQLDDLRNAATAWGKKVKGWEDERDELLQKLLSPEEQALLDGLGEEEKEAAMREIMREKFERGDITQEEYSEFLDLSENIAHGKAKQVELNAICDDIESALDAGEVPDLSKPLYDDAIAQYRAQGYDIDRTNATADDAFELFNFIQSSGYGLTSEIRESEVKILTIADLDQYKGQPDYIEKIDAFIKGADEETLDTLKRDESLGAEVSVRVGVHEFHTQISYLDGFKGTPEYAQYVEMAANDLPDNVREALRQEEGGDAVVQDVLNKSLNDASEPATEEAITIEEQGIPDNQPKQAASQQIQHPGMG